MAKYGCRNVHPYLFAGAMYRTVAECARDHIVTLFDAGNVAGVVFACDFRSVLSSVEREAAVRELVAFEALVSLTVRAVE